MKQLTALFLICSSLLPVAHAENVAYDFEIIIFEDVSGRYASSELWQHEILDQIGDQETQRDRGTGHEGETASATSPIKGIGLQKYASKLKARKRYNVLVQKAWRQTGFAEDQAIDIPIDSRTASSQRRDKNNIHGHIKIVLGRYLHIYTDLIYQKPNQNYNPALTGLDSQPFKQFPVKSHRRMRSKELHYLDHPMVGILVMAKPVKQST